MRPSACPFHPSATVAPGATDQEELMNFFRHAEAEGLIPQGTRARLLECEMGKGVTFTSDELAFAGRLAWRNSARCIGRLFWRSLQVRDCRGIASAEGMFGALVDHLTLATQNGAIRPVMTVFAPAQPDRRGPRIRNRQLAGYAGYRAGATILGDPINAAFTDEAIALGWKPPHPKTAFDLLPWILEGVDEPPRVFALPSGLIKEVPLMHPEFPWFGELGLRWYAVPVVSDMELRVAGATFSAAPFNGWYMGTEIGSRNLGDEQRYNLLPIVAQKLGLDFSSRTSLWKDRALLELNAAVLHSFAAAGCRIVDHHTASDEFMRFCALENQAGREVSADWAWIVPPLSGSATAPFHLPMTDLGLRPELFRPD